MPNNNFMGNPAMFDYATQMAQANSGQSTDGGWNHLQGYSGQGANPTSTPTTPTTTAPTTTTTSTVPNSTATPSSPTNDLSDLTYYNNRSYGGVGQEEINSQRAQAMLSNLHKYDPNAAFNQTYGSDGQSLGYQLQFDPSKLPGTGRPWDNNGQLGGINPSNAGGPSGTYAGGSGFLPRWSTATDPSKLINPNAVYDTNNYGRITDNRNLKQPAPDWLDKFGTFAPIALAMMTGGMGALPSLLMKAPGMINNMVNGNFDPLQLAGAALPYIPGVSPVMSSLGRIGLNTIDSQRRGG